MKNNRENYVNFRVTPVERMALNEMAKSEGRNISEQMRKIIQEAAWTRGLVIVIKQERPAIERLARK